MSKRTIHECDLTKLEFDPTEEKVFMLSIAVKGRKAPMKYELSSSAAERLLAQLNGSETLSANWSFGDHKAPVARETTRESSKKTLGDLENEDPIEDDSHFVAEKKKELRAKGVIDAETPREQPDSGLYQQPASSNGCSHLNKGRIQTTMRDKKRYIYRQCNGCGREIEEAKASAKKSYMSGNLPAGVNLKDYNK